MNTNKCMLSTFDNPFNPYENFDEWFAFDVAKGYYTCSLLDRLVEVPEDTPVEIEEQMIQNAIEELVNNDSFELYIKVCAPKN